MVSTVFRKQIPSAASPSTASTGVDRQKQLYLEQQSFLKRVLADQGIEAVAESDRWILNAGQEEFTAHIAKYPGAPGPSSRIAAKQDELGEIFQGMLAKSEETRQKLILKKAQSLAGKQ